MKGKFIKALAIAVATATLVAGAVLVFAPEVPPLGAVSAWMGTALTLTIWFVIYR